MENSDIISVFLVSTYNHNIASTDMSGIDANIPLMKILRFVISEMITINAVVINIFDM